MLACLREATPFSWSQSDKRVTRGGSALGGSVRVLILNYAMQLYFIPGAKYFEKDFKERVPLILVLALRALFFFCSALSRLHVIVFALSCILCCHVWL